MNEHVGESSKVVPVLVAALLCDVAVVDPSSGKKNLLGIFDRLWAATFPTVRPMTLYCKVTDAEGVYTVRVQILRSDKSERIGEATGQVTIPNRLQAYDFLMPFPPLPFPEPGRYEFRIEMSGVYLGSSVLDAHAQKRGGEA